MGCTCCRRISTRKWRNCICPHSVLTSRLSQKSKRTTLVWDSKALSSLQHTVIRNMFLLCLFVPVLECSFFLFSFLCCSRRSPRGDATSAIPGWRKTLFVG